MVNKFSVLVADIITFIGVIVLLACCCVIYASINNINYEYLHNFGTNWQTGPVTSIETKANSTTCPVNSQPLIESFFPGNIAGCNCKGYVYNTACTKSQFDSNCTNVNATPSMRFKGWGDSSFCGNRISKGYFQQVLDNTNHTCPEEYKQCGIVDTFGNKLCLRNNETCPVNLIKIIPNTAQLPNDFNYTVKALSSIGKKLIFTNENINGTILNTLVISDGLPCIDPTETHLGNQTLYLLDPTSKKKKCSTQFNNSLYDNSYTLLDTMEYRELLAQNALLSLVTKLPDYPSSSLNHTVSLFYKPYIGVNQTCLRLANQLYPKEDTIINKLMDKNENFAESKANPVSSAALGFLIFFIIFLFLLVKFCIYLYYEKQVMVISRVYLNAVLAFFILLLFIAGIVACIRISSARNVYIWLSNDPHCTDPLTYFIINKHDSSLATAYCAAVLFTILALILLILPLFEYLLAGCGVQKDKQDNLDQLNDEEDMSDNEDDEPEITKDPKTNEGDLLLGKDDVKKDI